MNRRFQVYFTAVTLTTAIGLVSLSDDADACGGRFRLFPGRSFSAQQCVPLEILPSAPEKKPAVVVEPVKEPPLPAVNKDMRVNAKNIADLLKMGKTPMARKLAANVTKEIEDFADLMALYRPRNKGGLGWGPNGPMKPAQDGIENMLTVVGRGKPANPLKDAANHEEAAYWLMAMAELTIAKAPKKDGGAKASKKAWLIHASDLRDAAAAMQKGAAGYDAVHFRQAATWASTACNKCHVIFKN
jgi:hypothetical protein